MKSEIVARAILVRTLLGFCYTACVGAMGNEKRISNPFVIPISSRGSFSLSNLAEKIPAFIELVLTFDKEVNVEESITAPPSYAEVKVLFDINESNRGYIASHVLGLLTSVVEESLGPGASGPIASFLESGASLSVASRGGVSIYEDIQNPHLRFLISSYEFVTEVLERVNEYIKSRKTEPLLSAVDLVFKKLGGKKNRWYELHVIEDGHYVLSIPLAYSSSISLNFSKDSFSDVVGEKPSNYTFALEATEKLNLKINPLVYEVVLSRGGEVYTTSGVGEGGYFVSFRLPLSKASLDLSVVSLSITTSASGVGSGAFGVAVSPSEQKGASLPNLEVSDTYIYQAVLYKRGYVRLSKVTGDDNLDEEFKVQMKACISGDCKNSFSGKASSLLSSVLKGDEESGNIPLVSKAVYKTLSSLLFSGKGVSAETSAVDNKLLKEWSRRVFREAVGEQNLFSQDNNLCLYLGKKRENVDWQRVLWGTALHTDQEHEDSSGPDGRDCGTLCDINDLLIGMAALSYIDHPLFISATKGIEGRNKLWTVYKIHLFRKMSLAALKRMVKFLSRFGNPFLDRVFSQDNDTENRILPLGNPSLTVEAYNGFRARPEDFLGGGVLTKGAAEGSRVQDPTFSPGKFFVGYSFLFDKESPVYTVRLEVIDDILVFSIRPVKIQSKRRFVLPAGLL